MTPGALPVLSGDRVLLERVLIETGARTDAPDASWTAYVQSLLEQVVERIADVFRPLGTLLHVAPEVLGAAAWLILAATAGIVALMLVRLATRKRSSQARPPRPLAEPGPSPVPLAAASWADELERRLNSGHPRAALEALWWWLARRLAGPQVEASWTTRELLSQAQRGDLTPLGHRLDCHLYGAGEPALGEVRTLASQFRAALP